MGKKIFVTGSSGFVGGAIIRQLLAGDYTVQALIHRQKMRAPSPGVIPIQGDIFDTRKLAQAMRGCQAVIHLVGIIREYPARGSTFQRIHVQAAQCVIDAARDAGVRRYLHMSALGARNNAPSRYHQTKFLAEEYVRHSGMDWTIFRPSVIHGPGGELTGMEAGWARGQIPPYLFMPYFGGGLFGTKSSGKIQPVYVKDVARAFVDALEKPQAIGKTYELAGPDILTWPELHRAMAQAIVDRRRSVVAIPAWWAMTMASVLPASILPFNTDQVIMSLENNIADSGQISKDLGWRPQAFGAALREYAGEL